MKTLFLRSDLLINGNFTTIEIGKKILTKLANALIGKMEIGAPMASMYLLGHPDHYMNQVFVNFFWKNFVIEALQTSPGDDYRLQNYYTDKTVLLNTTTSEIYAVSPVYDYIYRPTYFDKYPLYDWILVSKKFLFKKKPDNDQDQADPSTDKDEITESPDVPQAVNDQPSNNIFYFLAQHPQSKSYAILLVNKNNKVKEAR